MRFVLMLPLASSLLLTGCIMTGFDFGPSNRFQEDFHYSYPLQPDGRVNMESFNGSVEISGWDQDKVEIDGTKSASTEAMRDAIKIEIHNSPGSVDVRAVRPSAHVGNMGVRFVLHVPKKALLDRIATSNGSIRIQEVASAAHLKTSNGAIRIGNVTGDVEARTSNGSIDADEVHGNAVLRSSNGRIRAEDISGNCDAETSNSSIKVRLENAPSAPVRLATSNGSIDLTMAKQPKNDVHAETSNGGITVHLPSNLSARLTAETRNSSIHSDFDVASLDRGDDRHNRHLEGTIGSGGPAISLSTNNGQIRVVKGAAD